MSLLLSLTLPNIDIICSFALMGSLLANLSRPFPRSGASVSTLLTCGRTQPAVHYCTWRCRLFVVPCTRAGSLRQDKKTRGAIADAAAARSGVLREERRRSGLTTNLASKGHGSVNPAIAPLSKGRKFLWGIEMSEREGRRS